MPELPEVETVCRQLDAVLSGAVYQSSVIHDQKLPAIVVPAGRRVQHVRRSGKSVAIHFDMPQILRIQLRMTGRLCWMNRTTWPPHCRCVMVFDAGSLHLLDSRRFATVSLLDAPALDDTPLDPLEEGDGRDLLRRSSGRRLPVKAFLMDQKTIGGIGNIYASEVLHRAGISPWRRACDLDERRWRRVSKALKTVLTKAIECRGTTVSDWTDLFHQKGLYQNHLRVYGRTGKPCPRCGAPIIRTLLGGRATFFCTSCQET